MIARFITALCEPWSPEFRQCIAFAAGLALGLLLAGSARAQEHHAQGHAHYQNWVNQNGAGCCNDHDCGELAGDNERTVAGRIEVRIEGAWCPVLDHHYLKRGNAPDWSTAHVCVQHNYAGVKTSPCDRLLCYQPKPGI